jgi:hypothetical protein
MKKFELDAAPERLAELTRRNAAALLGVDNAG